MPMVSIIIPVYNAEKYIEKCIKSILEQNYLDFEILIIDDGSKDNTANIVRKLQNQDKRIKMIHQINSGPAIARNRGIDLANGKYIMFIDADDFIDQFYILHYLNQIESTNNDIVVGGFKRMLNGKVVSKIQLSTDEFSKYLVTGPVCRIIKRQFILDNQIYFLDTNSSEDVYFNICIYNKTNKISTIKDIGYNYVFNSSSLSNTVHKGFNQEVEILRLLDLINFKNGLNKEMNDYFIIKYCVWYLLYSGRTASFKEFIFEDKKLFDWLSGHIDDFENNKYVSLLQPKGEPFSHRFIIYSYMKLHKFKLIKIFARFYCKGVRKNA